MDTSSAEHKDLLRQVIDGEINSLQDSLWALKSRRNTLAPISRLPPETLTAIFSFLPPSAWVTKAGNLTMICITHVCRQWRETALNYPHLWSDFNFTKLTQAAVMAEIFARAQTMPLNLEADVTKWSIAQSGSFERQLEAHISHTRHLNVTGRLHTVLKRLASSAPILESLSLSNKSSLFPLPQVVIPVNLFNWTAPKLTRLELDSCDISWKSPLLRGLRNLKILKPYKRARHMLEDWLDALNEMPQLETLILEYATPHAPRTAPLISQPSRTATLPSLTGLHLAASATDCAFALAHLVLPALSWLHVNAESHEWGARDVYPLIPYVTRNVYGLGMEPLRSILISGEGDRAKVLGWTMPDADIKVSLPFWESYIGASGPPCIVFTATLSATRGFWDYGVARGVSDYFLTELPVDFVSTVITQNCTPPCKEFWIYHASRWPLLEHVLLLPATFLAFRDMLAEDVPSDGPRLPLLTKLTLIDDTLTELGTSHLCDMLIERVEQGVPLEVLDLSTCVADDRSIQLLREIVVDVHDEAAWRMIPEESVLNLHGGIRYCYQVEDDYGRVPCPCDDEDDAEDDDEDEEDDEEDDDD
jgi:F-box-like